MSKLAGRIGTTGWSGRLCLLAGLLAMLLVGTNPAASAQGLTPGGPVDFGTVPVGGTPVNYALNFSASVSTTIQSVNALTLGVANQDFKIVSQTCTGPIVPPQSCTVQVSFAPTAPGLRRGALSLTDSTGAVVNRVFLHGIGQGPQIVAMPPTVTAITSAATISPASFLTSALAVDGAGTTYFNDFQYSRVLKRTLSGAISNVGSVVTNYLSGMAIDGAGTLYISSSSLVYSLVPGGLPTPLVTGSIVLSQPRGLAVDAQGYLYIADAGLNEIVRIGPDGSAAVLSITGLSTPLKQPTGLAIDANNNLYIADTGNNRVVKTGIYSGTGTVLASSLNFPLGVAVDASGSVVVTDAGNQRLFVIPATGTAFPLTLSTGKLGTPVNATVTDAGDLEVADTQQGLLLLSRSTAAVSFPTPTHITVADNADDPEPAEILNSGNVPLVFAVPALGKNPVLSGAAFSLDASSTCPTLTSSSTATTIAVGTACQFGFDFTPVILGANTGSAVVSAMVTGGTAFTRTINLSGTGISNTASFSVVASPSLTQPGSTVGLTVTALKSDGTVDTTYIGTITFTATDATATFPAGSTYTFTAADAGVHVFTGSAGVIFHSTGTFTVSVGDGNASGTSNPVKVVQANGFTLVATPNVIGVGGTVSLTVTATFNGVIAPNYIGTITLSATDPAAKFLGGTTYTFTAADAGSHTFTGPSAVQFNTPGTFTISATDGTYTGTSNTVQVVQVDSFSVVASPTTVNVGGNVGYIVTAMYKGAVQTSFTGTITFTTSDAKGKFLGATTYTFTAADAGTHTFTAAQGIQFNTPGTQTVTVTDGALTGTSNGVTVIGVNGFVLIASPTSTAIGAPVALTIEATFNGTTIVPGYTGTVTFTATDATAKFLSGTSYTFTAADAGKHTFLAPTGVQFNQAGVFTVSATDGMYSGTSNAVTVGAANAFTLVASPSTININGTVSLTVQATYNGVVEPNYTGTVTFTATDPLAKFLSGTSYTFTAADQGQHTFTAAQGVQFNTAGTFTISATDGTISGTSNTVTVQSATGFTIIVTPSTTAVGAVNTFTITAVLNGATATQFTGAVTLTSTDATAKFLSGTTLNFTSANAGTLTFTAPATGVQFNHAGVFTVSAAGTSGGVAITGTSNQVTVIAANGFSIVASPTLIVPGASVGYTISATYNGTVVPNYVGTVTFSSTDPAAKFLSGTTYTFTPADNGSHTFAVANGVQLFTVGTQTISATDGTNSGTSNQIQVVVPNSFTIVASPNVTTVGTPVGFTISATYNGTVIPYTGTVTFTATDATAKFLSGTSYTFTAADAGTHTFTAAQGVQFNTPGTFTISATNGTATGTSNTVLVNPIANGFTIVATPSTTTAGTPVGYTVSATYNGVVVTGYTGTVTFSATDPAAKFLSGTTYTFTAADAGSHTFAAAAGVQFNTVGTFTISATDGVRSGTSNSVTVLGLDSLVVTAAPTVITAGNAVSFTVTAMLKGAVATNFTGTVTFTSTDPAVSFLSGTTYTFTAADQGSHTFTVANGAVLNTVGNQTITSTDATISGTSNVVQVVSAGSGFLVTATPTSTTVGSPVSLTVTAQQGGVKNTAFTGTVTFTATDSSAKFLSGTTYTFTAADAGTHTFTAPASGVQFNQTGVFTVTATSGALTGTSNPVTVSSSTVLVITATPSAISVGQSVGYTITAQQNGATQTGFTGTVSCTTGDPRATFISGASYTFTAADAGTHTFPASAGVTYNTVGTYTIVCTTGTGVGIVTGTSNQIQVTSTQGFLITATPTSTPTNTTVSFTVSAVNVGAVNTNYTGTVRFTSTDPAAAFLSGTSYTFTVADKGTHTFTAPASGVTFKTAGQQTISATDGTLSGTSNPVTVYSATGFSLVVTPNATTVGVPVGYTISATYNGQVVSNYTGTVTFTATDATAKFLSGNTYTFTAADNGTHAFAAAGGVQFNTAGTFTISATDGTISGTSNTVTVTGNVTSFVVTATPSTTTVGAPVALTVTAISNGATATGYTGTVTFTSTDATAKFLSGTTYTFTSADAGTHTFSAPNGVQFNQTGTYTVTASNGTASGTSNGVVVTAATTATSFTLVATPSATNVGAPVALTITAMNGANVAAGFTGTVTFTSTDATAKFLSGTTYTFTAADNGTHTFTAANGVQFNQAGTFTVTATNGTATGTSNSVVVSLATVATSFTVVASPATTTVGTPVSLTITAMNGSTVATGFTGTVTLSTTDTTAKFLSGTTYTFTAADAGSHTFAAPASGVQFNQTGTFTVSATNGTASGTSNNVVVTAATTATTFTVTATPATTSVGAPVALTITALNNGVTATAFTGTVTLTATDVTAKFLSGTTYTFTAADAGTHTFAAQAGVQFNTAGTYTVSVTNGTATGTSNTVTVVNTPATSFTVVATPATTSVGAPVALTITAMNGPTVQTGFVGTVTFTATDATAKFLSGTTYTFTAADGGTHSFPAAAGVQFNTAGTFTVTAVSGSSIGTSNSVVVTAAVTTATSFSVVATPSTTSVGSPVALTITALNNGATATGFTGTVTLTSTDATAKFLSGTTYTFTAADNGVHTFAPQAGVQFNTAGTFTVTAASGSSTGTSNTVTVVNTPATSFTLLATPSTTSVGAPVALTITAMNGSSVQTGFVGTVTFTATDSTAKFLSGNTYTFTAADKGTHTFNAPNGVQFNQTGTFTVTGTSGTSTGTSNSVVVTAAVTTATTFSVVATPSTTSVGAPVALTITALNNGATAAGFTGTVTLTATDPSATFLSGATYTFTAADSGTHTFAPQAGVQFNTAGTYTVSVRNGTATGTSNTVTVVNTPATSFTLVATPSTTSVGAPVALTITAMNGTSVQTGFVGTVTFTATDPSATFLSGTSYTFTAADNGTHTFAPQAGVQFNTAGTYTIKAISGSSAGTSNAVTVNASSATSFTLVATPSTTSVGAPVALTITAMNGTSVATGFVGTVTLTTQDATAKFLSGAIYSFTAADNGTHTFAAQAGVQFNSAGIYTINAVSGSATGTSNSVTVNALAATGFTVIATPTITSVGNPVAFTVTAVNGTATLTGFTGTVTFTSSDPAAKFLSGTTYTFTAADNGTHTFTAPNGAQFNTIGTQTVTASSGSATGTSNGVVVTAAITGFTLVATPSTTALGSPVALTITAMNGTAIQAAFAGTVTFTATDPAAKFLSGTTYTFTAADAGTHTFPAAAGVQFNTLGTFTITAASGTTTGTSNPVVVVNPSNVILSSSANPALTGSTVILTATIVVPGSATLPSGSVIFMDGTQTLGTAQVINGAAVLSVNFIPVGAHYLSAVYSGDATTAAGTSAVFTELVEDFSLALASKSSNSASVLGGHTATFGFLVSPVGGSTLAAPVALTVTGAPKGSVITFTPATIAAGQAATAVTLTITPPIQTGMVHTSKPFAERMAPLTVALVFLPLAWWKRRKMVAQLLMLALLALPLTAMTGCLSSAQDGYYGAPPQTYTLTVTATSGTIVHTTQVTLTVQ